MFLVLLFIPLLFPNNLEAMQDIFLSYHQILLIQVP